MAKSKCSPFVWILLCAAVLTVLLILWILTHFTSPATPAVDPTQAAQTPFSATADITFQNFSATADINRTAENQLTFCFTEPPLLRGIELTYDGQTVQAGYGDLKVSLSEDSLLTRSVVSILGNAFQAAGQEQGITVENLQDAIKLSGNTKDGSFTLRLDPEDASYLELSMPELSLQCTFSDFLFNEPSEQNTVSEP